MKWKNSGTPSIHDIAEIKANLVRLFSKTYDTHPAYAEVLKVLSQPQKRHALAPPAKGNGKGSINCRAMLDRSGARLDEEFKNINGELVCSVKLLPGVHNLVAS